MTAESPAGYGNDATISDCGRYRYVLRRRWGGGPPAVFVMLNPSTADATRDDPTIRRCIGFAKAWGLGALWVINLYAYRSTNPHGLWLVADPVGPDNDVVLTDVALTCLAAGGVVVAAWGAHARPERVARVLQLPGMDQLQCLGTTKHGAPRHPLYLRRDAALSPWPPREVHRAG